MRLVGGAFAVGVGVGVLGILVGVLTGRTLYAMSDLVFSLGALALGFGTLGWAGSILAKNGIESMQRHLDSGSNWTEHDSRRAMARVGGFGAGVMLGSVVGATVVSVLL